MAARTLGTILDRYRFSQGWQPLPDDDHNLTVAAWLEVLEIAGVPVEHFEACYKAARQTQMERRAAGESSGPLAAEDLAVEWLKIRKLHAEMEREGRKMLAENAASACQRCLGRKPAVDSCDHRPVTDEEMRGHAEEARRLRERLAQIPAVKPMPPVERHDLTVTYTCTECRRQVSSAFGWNYHDRCNERMPGPVRVELNERLACQGVMEVL